MLIYSTTLDMATVHHTPEPTKTPSRIATLTSILQVKDTFYRLHRDLILQFQLTIDIVN